MLALHGDIGLCAYTAQANLAVWLQCVWLGAAVDIGTRKTGT
jgi:hypothetical protein